MWRKKNPISCLPQHTINGPQAAKTTAIVIKLSLLNSTNVNLFGKKKNTLENVFFSMLIISIICVMVCYSTRKGIAWRGGDVIVFVLFFILLHFCSFNRENLCKKFFFFLVFFPEYENSFRARKSFPPFLHLIFEIVQPNRYKNDRWEKRKSFIHFISDPFAIWCTPAVNHWQSDSNAQVTWNQHTS